MAFSHFFSRMAWCSFNVSWESNQNPSQRVASLLNGISLPPTLILAVGVFLFLWKRAVSVFHGQR